MGRRLDDCAARMDHRLGSRYRAFRLVELRFDDVRRSAGILYNISRNGMFVLTTAEPGLNRCVEVRIATPGETLRLHALVVHRSNGGLGLMFRHLDGDADAALEELCSWR